MKPIGYWAMRPMTKGTVAKRGNASTLFNQENLRVSTGILELYLARDVDSWPVDKYDLCITLGDLVSDPCSACNDQKSPLC